MKSPLPPARAACPGTEAQGATQGSGPGGEGMVAALYVQPGGVYYGPPGVEPWGLPERDARDYAGPWPVVAHPPCSRWCRLAGLVEARWGHKRGDDGGCFAAALASVRRWGGVLEHPAYSDAWKAHDLMLPPTGGGWVNADFQGGWTCYVEQWRYGHRAKKATWLYCSGVDALPTLEWGCLSDRNVLEGLGKIFHTERRRRPIGTVSWCGNHTKSTDKRPRLSKREASQTPIPFRDVLLSIARSSRRQTRG
jgi:hypothetical protein